MLMIPLPYIFALGALIILWRFVLVTNTPNKWLIVFLGLVAFQEILIGTRFGYGIEVLRKIQPLSAALIAPLAYVSFTNPKLDWRLITHLLPFAAVVISLSFYPVALDSVLALSNLSYAILLIMLALRGTDALSWASFGEMRNFQRLLWVSILLLVFSGLADALIFLDFWKTDGANTHKIASGISLLGLALVLGGFLYIKLSGRTKTPQSIHQDDNHLKKVFQTLNKNLKQTRLHNDPEINLGRIARRFAMPTRDVSRAINSQANENVSQYINRLRILDACELLKTTDMQVTQIIYAVGFNTKSNFNREFSRVTGQTPSQWRNNTS